MNKLFLITFLKNEHLQTFKTDGNTSHITWAPVRISETENEIDIFKNFYSRGFTVIGIESLELLQQKIKILGNFEQELKIKTKSIIV